MQQTAVKVDIPALLPSWRRSLRAARRSPRAVQSYTEAATDQITFRALLRTDGERVDLNAVKAYRNSAT